MTGAAEVGEGAGAGAAGLAGVVTGLGDADGVALGDGEAKAGTVGAAAVERPLPAPPPLSDEQAATPAAKATTPISNTRFLIVSPLGYP